MKRHYAFLLVFITGCSSDLDIKENHSPVPVVYAAIDPYDTVHYVSAEWTGMQLNWQAMDSLCKGYLYKEMKFRN